MLESVPTVSVEVEEPGLGVKVTVEPEGLPVRLSVTAPLKPLAGEVRRHFHHLGRHIDSDHLGRAPRERQRRVPSSRAEVERS